MDNEIILTKEGREKLVAELEYREGEKHEEIIERLKEARDFGDLSENAEYDAAKEEQSQNESRIAEIRKILANARIEEGGSGSSKNLAVAIGCTVEVVDDRGRKAAYVIVGTTETDSLAGRISNESPLGEALIGHKKDEKITWVTPSGQERELTVVSVTR